MMEFRRPGSKSEGSISDGSESLSDTSSMRAWRDMVGVDNVDVDVDVSWQQRGTGYGGQYR